MRCRQVIVAAIIGIAAVGCDGNQSSAPSAKPEACKQSDSPTADTVRQAIAKVPIEVAGSIWVEIGRGRTKKCRLNWVQIIPSIASESTPQQLLFFDRNTPLGSPTPNPKPYTTVLPPSSDDSVTVQYQWRVGNDEECCPSQRGTVKFQIGPDGKLKASGPIPHQS